MVLGALVVPGPYVARATAALEEVLARHRMTGSEFKWTKVSTGKADCYREVVGVHFDELCSNGVQFHALVLDQHGIDHRCYNQGDEDLGYNKWLYQLLLHRVGKPFGSFEKIVVDLDNRNTSRDPVELQRILNSKMGSLTGTYLEPPFARIAHRDSKGTRLLQLTDLLAGAVAWHKNDHDSRPDASAAKAALANEVARRVGLFRFGSNSPKRETRVSVWNMSLLPRGGAR